MRDLSSLEYLLNDPSIERWLRKRPELTRYYYLKRFDKFLSFIGPELGVKEPKEFLAWAKSRTDSLDVLDIVEKFGESQSKYSQRFAQAVVRSYLKRNGYANLGTMTGRATHKDIHPEYKREEVIELLGFLDDKIQKLYVYLAKDSGLRAADILSLRYGHVKDDFESEKGFVHIAFEPQFYERRKASGITFIGPNTVKLLRELVKAGKIRAECSCIPSKNKAVLHECPLIFPFKYPTINVGLRLARNKAGLDARIQPSHGLRKFFTNSLSRVGMDHHRKLQLEGHSLGVEWSYTAQDIEELRKLYQQAYQFLDLSEEAAADSRLKELEKSLAEKTQYIEALKSELEERVRVLEHKNKTMMLYQLAGPDIVLDVTPEDLRRISAEELERALMQFLYTKAREAREATRKHPVDPALQELGRQIGRRIAERRREAETTRTR
ncbi:hypothetical protein AUG19_02745 [archaeon 13_1_20CM_2_54_9]|nr:MAG: hypothetical protein AUG19_02745 [archaeon 13_1_20CM_2_54_9]